MRYLLVYLFVARLFRDLDRRDMRMEMLQRVLYVHRPILIKIQSSAKYLRIIINLQDSVLKYSDSGIHKRLHTKIYTKTVYKTLCKRRQSLSNNNI